MWGNRRAYILHKAIGSAGNFAENQATVAAALALIAAFVANSQSSCTNRCVIALVAFGFAGLISGGEGSANNYFLESAGLVCMVLGVYGLSALWRLDQGRTALVLSVAGFGIILAVSANTVTYLRAGGKAPDLATVKNRAGTEFVMTPAVNDPFFYGVVVKNHAVEASRLVEDMKSGRVSALVLAKPLEQYTLAGNEWPAEIVDVMQSHYEPAGRADSGYVYLFHASD